MDHEASKPQALNGAETQKQTFTPDAIKSMVAQIATVASAIDRESMLDQLAKLAKPGGHKIGTLRSEVNELRKQAAKDAKAAADKAAADEKAAAKQAAADEKAVAKAAAQAAESGPPITNDEIAAALVQITKNPDKKQAEQDFAALVRIAAKAGFSKQYITDMRKTVGTNLGIIRHAEQKQVDAEAILFGQVEDPSPKAPPPIVPPSEGQTEAEKMRAALAPLKEKTIPQEWIGLRPSFIPLDKFAAKIGRLLPWVYQRDDDILIHRDTGEEVGVLAFNRALNRECPMILKLDSTGSPLVDKSGNVITVKHPAFTLLIDHLHGEIVSQSMYRPDLAERFFHAEGLRYVNSFLPSSVPKVDPKNTSRRAWRKCVHHILAMYGRDGRHLIRWMAYVVQNPGKRVRWSPLLQGPEGDGKTTIGMMMEAAIGAKNYKVISNEALASDFNAWAEGAMVGFAEEIYTAATGRKHVLDKLKVVITNDRIAVVCKGRDEKQVRNVLNIMAATNRDGAINISIGDRRFAVLRSIYRDRKHLLELRDDAYFTSLITAIKEDKGTIRAALLAVDLKGFNPNTAPPASAAKLAMVRDARDPLEGSIAEVVQHGGIGLHQDACLGRWVAYAVEQNNGIKTVTTTALAAAMRGLGYDGTIPDFKFEDHTYTLYYRRESVLELEGQPAKLRDAFRKIIWETIPAGKSDAIIDPPWRSGIKPGWKMEGGKWKN